MVFRKISSNFFKQISLKSYTHSAGKLYRLRNSLSCGRRSGKWSPPAAGLTRSTPGILAAFWRANTGSPVKLGMTEYELTREFTTLLFSGECGNLWVWLPEKKT